MVSTVNPESVGSAVDEINIQQQKSLQSNHKNRQLTIEPSTIDKLNHKSTIDYQKINKIDSLKLTKSKIESNIKYKFKNRSQLKIEFCQS